MLNLTFILVGLYFCAKMCCLTCVLEENLVHVSAGVLEQLVVRVEDDDRDLTVAEDGQLVGFLHQTEFALGESDLPVRRG